jgi:dihydroorotase
LTLVRNAWEAPAELAFGDATVVPIRAGEALAWRLA